MVNYAITIDELLIRVTHAVSTFYLQLSGSRVEEKVFNASLTLSEIEA